MSHPDDPSQPRSPQPGALPGARCICPHGGHSHGGYDQQASTVLDCLDVAAGALSEAKRLIEEEVLP